MRIYVAGHRGMVGQTLTRRLVELGHEVVARSRAELDLLDQAAVARFFATERIDQVYVAAAKVGGIHANMTYPAQFIYENLLIAANITHQAFVSDVKRLLFLGSSCIYPRLADQPIREDALLTGKLEPTNEPYAIAKIAGIKLCESYNRQYGATHGIDYRSVMPSNLYGPGDNYHLENSHVVPALIQRFHLAKISRAPSVLIWGSGRARREFLYVDDMVEGCLDVMNLPRAAYDQHTDPMRGHINLGTGEDVSIAELVEQIRETVGYEGSIRYDLAQPDGAPRKLLDVSRAATFGWRATVPLAEGLRRTYADYQKATRPVDAVAEHA
ncbi:GDP-L-fucose synthase [Variovorax boronicumulans]|uniref:GDP-L-fucose synthase n=1 Tax=Variovorax boronicumulans TaxID=436515 RepID=A0AAW8CLQ4_9BURK|nr:MULTISPECIES: GDP-L-fucose synthase [Variovorax]MDP9891202.1 GDP-L-fucose synthase [Variovorax boronicumulans]MDP9991924.1 GDP-L-fucose synthase [Variovorax boronicumulans]MDQ0001819.1 GDP-L-fucose synthase [Variovorax boronicumulans]MDQ0035594.1 GDP-L-fucose synthase [Variovorax boronicumulans]MDQ0040341.1 GDP-L-fucose synthase [Variovorax boronicumulans]